MGLIVRFATSEVIELVNDDYTNCHQFSREVFLKMASDSHKYKKELGQATNDTGGITAIYERMIQSGDAKKFEVKDCAEIPARSLIIFADAIGVNDYQKLFIQHSMIAIDKNHWMGANNLYSLGADSLGVKDYVNLSQYKQKLEKYVLYHISF